MNYYKSRGLGKTRYTSPKSILKFPQLHAPLSLIAKKTKIRYKKWEETNPFWGDDVPVYFSGGGEEKPDILLR